MKTIFFIALLNIVGVITVNAQEIPAVTNNGRKVILNKENFTWRYMNPEESDSPCQTNKTGSLKIVNNTNYDIYFFYCTYINSPDDLKTVTVKKNSTKTIKDILVGNSFAAYAYNWKVTYEMPFKINTFSGISGFQNGIFNVDVCGLKEIIID